MDPTPSNIVGRCCTLLNEVAKRMQRVGFSTWNREVWVQNLSILQNKGAPYWFLKMVRGRSTVKRCLAAIALLEMSEDEDDSH